MKKYCIIILILCILFTSLPTVVLADNSVKYQLFPDYYFTECPQQGTIHVDTIQEKRTNREALIWTPYNYNENTKYDVIILLHGGGGSIHDWLDNEFNIRRNKLFDKIQAKNIYDWITYEHKSKPFIICTLTNNPYNRDETSKDAITAFKYIAENYSTYAIDGSDESIIDARNHFWIGGLSQGCITTYYFMSKYNKYTGNYICLSMTKSAEYNSGIVEGLAEYPINYMYMACGNKDRYNHFNGMNRDFEFFAQNSKDIKYTIFGYNHDWNTWINSIYDVLTTSKLLRVDFDYIKTVIKDRMYKIFEIV